ncbi:MAG: hypothetical protein K0S74_236 [Chlamydiales bacterium]|nr:hypothetical protein [Chlamydiales bacterium]
MLKHSNQKNKEMVSEYSHTTRFDLESFTGEVIDFKSELLNTGLSSCLKLEYATTKEELEWGVMGRHRLNPNEGVLFQFQDSCIRHFWSFNCWFDLSVAFISSEQVITQIGDLPAFPAVMKRLEPIPSLKELKTMTIEPSIIQFFMQHELSSEQPAQYVLEVNKGWFKQNGVQVGDCIWWDSNTGEGRILKALDLSEWDKINRGILLDLGSDRSYSLSWKCSREPSLSKEIILLDKERRVITKEDLKKCMFHILPVEACYILLSPYENS